MADSSFEGTCGIERMRSQYRASTSSCSVGLTSRKGEEVVKDTLFVALGAEVKEGERILKWVLQNHKEKKICLIHVHKPPQTISMLGGNFPISQARPEDVREHLAKAKQKMLKVLEEYAHICIKAGVRAEKIYIEKDSIRKGIVELVSRHRIGNLAMGAGASTIFSWKMREPRSEKAKYACKVAPTFCHIWFIYEGVVLYTREGTGFDCFLGSSPFPEAASSGSSTRLLDRHVAEEIDCQLEQAMAEVKNSISEALRESMSRRKTEKVAINAIHKAKVGESLYSTERRKRNDIEEEVAMLKEELEHIKNHGDIVLGELLIAEAQKSLLEDQMMVGNLHVKKLEEKLVSDMKRLQRYKENRKMLQIERDNALSVAEERRPQLELLLLHPSDSNSFQRLTTFSLLEIEEATNCFHRSLKIGEGGYGRIYKGSLRHTEVAIKMLRPDSKQGPEEFYREVDILSKLRHQNIITLIGVCPEIWALVYEYLPNGSLEDRLACKGNSPPLSWQVRLQIAAELCSVLIFLRCNAPLCIIHCDLKPSNILLDGRMGCRLSDFGISRVVAPYDLHVTEKPKGTYEYIDPVFLQTGKLSTESDVYAYGIILLRLLTGRPAEGIKEDVRSALERKNLHAILDPSAGDWPLVQAHMLASLALRCCDRDRENRPDLVAEVWKTLEPHHVEAYCY